ncbi:MAG: DUF1343 domain-containing protein [Bdellovibrionales bacterium]|nr:DUF1343 domain-containing protein [Bdellovibrionales bacterium]
MEELQGKRVALFAHPASVDRKLRHAVDLLFEAGIELTCLFGPQHGIKGDKQDNMIETADEVAPVYKIPAYSLYGKVRRPTEKMLADFDLMLFDLQDVGCRIYTYLTTLVYLLEDFEKSGHELWVLDRPNPAGRPIEGTYLLDDFHSFVGAAPLPMRHGLTLGEAANWYKATKSLSTKLEVIAMQDYSMTPEAGWGWPTELPWVNPSPNIPTVTSTRVFCGSVLLEGTFVSEGRGTTRALELLGAPMIEPDKLVSLLRQEFSEVVAGCELRPCYFEPTFQKHAKHLCGGFQVHVDDALYDEKAFQPYRLFAAALRCLRKLYPEFELFKKPPYEYEEKLLPIEILSGSTALKTWVESEQPLSALDEVLRPDEQRWASERKPFLLYQ